MINPADTSGTDLAALLGNFRDALNSGHLGAGRPPYAEAGTTWIEASGNIWKINVFDGTNDITLFELNIASNALSSPIFNAALYLLKTGGHITGNLSVGGMALANKILVGVGSGSVGLITNDGFGNSNLTFNHQAGVPDNDSLTQSAGRISFSTDQNAASCIFSLADSTTQGVPVATQEVLRLDLSEAYFSKNVRTNGALSANWVAGNWVATKPEAEAGTSNDQIMTPLRTANSIEANQAVRAWVNFDGANGNIRAAHNVSSVVRNGQGNYTVNLATSMDDTNYAVSGTAGVNSPTAAVASLCPDPSNSTATSVAVRCGYTNQGTGGFLAIDPQAVSIQVSR